LSEQQLHSLFNGFDILGHQIVSYDKLQEVLLQQLVIQADENTLKVINENKAKCYICLYCSFDYQTGRAGQCALDYPGM